MMKSDLFSRIFNPSDFRLNFLKGILHLEFNSLNFTEGLKGERGN